MFNNYQIIIDATLHLIYIWHCLCPGESQFFSTARYLKNKKWTS